VLLGGVARLIQPVSQAINFGGLGAAPPSCYDRTMKRLVTGNWPIVLLLR